MAWPSASTRTKNWGTEVLTDTDLEGALDELHTYNNDQLNSSTGHKHDGTTSEGPKIAVLASTVAGATTFSGTLTDENGHSGGFVPAGCILMWSGAISAIPTGWVICDGNNSTPDLTDRFVIHADADAAGTNDVGDTGGASTHSLSQAELPSANLTASVPFGSFSTGAGAGQSLWSGGDDDGTDVTFALGGSGTAHTNRDKFYALAYIMKS